MSIRPESVQVWVVRLPEHDIQHWRPLLSASEWERALRFRMPADQQRFAITRGILRTLLGRYLAMPAAAIEFTANDYGKPAVAGPIRFNVSHSGDYALLAFANQLHLGIDVERISGERVVAELAQRILSPGEYQRFNAIAPARRTSTFFQIWTLKESLLKGIGSGLSVAPQCLEVAFYPHAPKLLASQAPQITDVKEWTLRSLSIGHEGYAAAIAVKHANPLIEFQQQSLFL